MATFVYGGIKYIQTRHAVYCKLCKNTVESKFIHDFKMCSCNSVGVDGGIVPGNSILGSLENMELRSIYYTYVNGKRIWLAPDVIETAHLNTIAKYKQNDKVKGRESQGDSHLAKEATKGGSSS